MCSFDVTLDGRNAHVANLSLNINRELQAITEWLEINKLSLNIKKTKFMIFHFPQRNIKNFNPNIQIKSRPIQRVTLFDFLGLIIDENLSWTPHLQKITSKISRTLGVMNRLKRFLPAYILMHIYNSLILPHLQSFILIWGHKSSKVFRLQKRAIQMLTLSRYNARTEPLFKRLNLLKVEDMFSINILKFYFKYKHGTLPVYFQNMFPLVSHNYNTRGNLNKIRMNKRTTANCENIIRNSLPRIVEKFPLSVLEKIETHSFNGFKNYVKKVMLDNYDPLCHRLNCFICNH